MSIDKEEFQRAEEEVDQITSSPGKVGEEYENITEQLNEAPEQLIWKYIYTNVSGSLRKALTEDPPETFPSWLKELFAEEYEPDTGELPPDEFINKALEHIVRRRISA